MSIDAQTSVLTAFGSSDLQRFICVVSELHKKLEAAEVVGYRTHNHCSANDTAQSAEGVRTSHHVCFMLAAFSHINEATCCCIPHNSQGLIELSINIFSCVAAEKDGPASSLDDKKTKKGTEMHRKFGETIPLHD